jgi:hypothetical protein
MISKDLCEMVKCQSMLRENMREKQNPSLSTLRQSILMYFK